MADETPKIPATHGDSPKSTSELMASAKTVAEAAQFAVSNQSDKIDKAKTSEAAEDVLEAAKKYGKLDDNSGVGQYVGKAEGYLHNLHDSSDKDKPAAEIPIEGSDKKVGATPSLVEAEGGENKESAGGGGGGGGGVMDMAKGLFSK